MGCNFGVGDKVICICVTQVPGRPDTCRHASPQLELNKEYTVLDLGPLCPQYSDIYCTVNNGYEGGWAVERFRPVLKKSTDISIFNELLRPTDKPKVKDATKIPENV